MVPAGSRGGAGEVFRSLGLTDTHCVCVLRCLVLTLQPHDFDFAASWTAAHQVPLSMEFSRQEYWNSCYFLLQGIFPTQELNQFLRLLHWQANSLPLVPPGKPNTHYTIYKTDKQQGLVL